MQPTEQTTITLSRGTLTLDYQLTDGYQLADLLGFAERINPKRAFLFVSNVLGRHIPVAPSRMEQAFNDLADLIPEHLPTPMVIIGMAETAVGLSAGVHQRLQTRPNGQAYPEAILLNSTRHAQPATLLATFSEDHSHASQHLIYQSADEELQQQVLQAKTVIMVDDEASTGKTCHNLIQALQAAGLTQIEQVHLATLVDWSLDKPQLMHDDNIDFYRHHLLSGRWQWVDHPNAPTVKMPNVATTDAGNQPVLDTGNWGRLPTQDSQAGLPTLLASLQAQLREQGMTTLAQLAHKSLLVLGSNEFVWLPFLLARHLEDTLQHSHVKFSALTRSPIAVQAESAITACFSFSDNYGLGMTNFVYNVVPSDWDAILLCIETPSDSVDEIWRQLPNVMIIAPETTL